MSASPDDAQFMQEAIRLGLLHLGQTSTNPSVGCVIVRDGKIVGRGTTAVGGRPHAEPQALAEAGELAHGATAYVTLEPCSHHGKTPPCADALIASGVSRVVISVTDPDERVSGRGIAMLRDAGITVETGLLEEEGRQSLAAYLTRQTKNRPYVILKLAVSEDGMIGRVGEGQIAITGPAARAEVQQLRAETDAILVGIGTAVADDPELTVRIQGLEGRSPVRIVLDPLLELPLTSKLVRTARQVPVIVVGREEVSEAWEQDLPPSVLPDISPTRGEIDSLSASPETIDVEASGHPQPISPLVGEMPGRAEVGIPTAEADASNNQLDSRRKALEASGVEVVYCHPYHPEQLLPALASRGISSLLVEGGAKTARLFLEAGYVDRILLYQGPGMIGEGGIETPIRKTDIPSDFKHVGTRRVGDDSLDEYEREV
ncbi:MULTISPECIES: bifunctional diaminohydroxyphosphoribosylaminopyrimidine deaminase/5-amino-6-(5-phosphoribosylamino)uracil reductase RibD [unclassified Rhizobium]|uniref:bifunctional diaminohydroxyphosphoribosylaminopyrimidine deaminase/5-amino-6-(5-phosphoribosylamino)uracil reductase RibD n=1 Tax=unclassified Rhizobium TaxID=2613769 RepID=UPI001AD9923D|nr:MULTISPECIES: bifunctional diaminohydroxyphosphoribosylaminopyrimidine deaminase/5-amino-6-(5-phosphoribosylamino)uracil reductase RibD [unclassified Rhizobium]MBO9123427.1 bifunctional diaminohydroxyphosphoribosylaminopyrimidine deaminase/5-amino-6-(5-phosphoribosylamino)uracil reductase RibD [Rhizobium sp. 16-488-2b]MBO9173959.1 bifunctional diaminohydroxyphosphoribosylaminopyrimidine deaminase/5-amino-6-(5-phosphoribosylamino)uracil reductase RibD [Rhizobium sp. 16-488-2a]